MLSSSLVLGYFGSVGSRWDLRFKEKVKVKAKAKEIPGASFEWAS